mgnify:CR=1 FL=1
MTEIRWGILATGGIAHAFTQDLRTAGRTVTAVGSRNADSARAFAAEYDIPHAHGSYEALVADDLVDVVEHGRGDGVTAQRLEGRLADELQRSRGGDDPHLVAGLAKVAQQQHRLVGGDPPGDTEDDAHVRPVVRVRPGRSRRRRRR